MVGVKKMNAVNGTMGLIRTSVATVPLMWSVAPAYAQNAAAENAAQPSITATDIVVTARKRNETTLSAPVTVTAISSAELSRRSVTQLDDIAKLVPSLFLTPQDNNQQGGAVSIRGISGVYENPLSDQAVAFNVDGVQVARASVKRLGDFDLANVQVLEGPQALYFGKNSPAGIVVIKSADPTKRLSAGGSVSYEVVGHEAREEAFIAGPISDTAGFRVAGYGDQLNGWITDTATADPTYGPLPYKLPHDREYGGRITLTYNPSAAFNARLKLAADTLHTAGFHEGVQIVRCPTGHYQFGGPDNCIADNQLQQARLGPNFFKLFGAPWRPDGLPSLSVQQYIAGLEMNFHISNSLVLSSQTSYYRQDLDGTSPFNGVDATALSLMIGGREQLGIREISQEVRLTSSFSGPINFMIGGYYQHSNATNVVTAGLDALKPFVIAATRFKQTGNAPSVFGSITYKPIDQIEISGGARASWEKKSIFCYNSLSGELCDATFPQGTAFPTHTWHNISPEATVAWRPTARITAYASYKQGFLSGGFNANSGDPTTSRQYDQETVKGFEAGVKGLLFNGTLRTTLDAWSYKIGGQQVSAVLDSGATAGAAINVVISNAAASRTKGAEAHFDWTSPIPGLQLRGGITYMDAYYSRFTNSSCYTGQTPAEGCNLEFANGAFNAQDLSGAKLPRAPSWTESIGTTYNMKDSSGNEFTLSVDANHTSSYIADETNAPFNTQGAYWLLDASLQYEMRSGIQLAVIGKNLTNKYYFQDLTNEPFTGGGTGTAAGFQGDSQGGVSRGREVIFRASVKFN